MRILAAILPFCLASGAIAQTKAPAKSALDKATLEAYLRHVELYRGPVTFQIGDATPSKYLPGFLEVPVHLSFDGGSKDETYYVSKDGQTIVNGDVYNINRNPFQENVDRLTTKDAPTFGPANAPVTIVEFGDFECPDCRMEAPVLRKNLAETFPDKVRVFFKDFPLQSIHPWALAAAVAGRCVYRQDHDAFWKFYDWDYATQEELNGDNLKSQVLDWAGKNGLDPMKLGQCIDTKATEADIYASIAEGRMLDVHGTPTLFINGRKIGGLQWPDLELVINNELKYIESKK